jgi:hypothetical protein
MNGNSNLNQSNLSNSNRPTSVENGNKKETNFLSNSQANLENSVKNKTKNTEKNTVSLKFLTQII